MSREKSRVLIFGAGVIGSIYAHKFFEAGIDVTLFARGNRLASLQEHGLQYSKNGGVSSVNVRVIDSLENDDLYDFIFVAVRYDQAEGALLALKDNQSKTIVTMTNNAKGFSSWTDIVGERLVPGFPGFGGQIKDEVLYARVPPKALQASMFGEISGRETERTEQLKNLFDTAKLPCTIKKDMGAYLITHSVSDIALLCNLYARDGAAENEGANTKETARRITRTLKSYLRALRDAGLSISPSAFKAALYCPGFIMDAFFVQWLQSQMVQDMLLPDYAIGAEREAAQLKRDLLELLKQHGVAP